MSLEKKYKVRLPMMPNFLTLEITGYAENDKPKIDVRDLTDSEIEELGKEWTEKLKKHAETRRKNQIA